MPSDLSRREFMVLGSASLGFGGETQNIRDKQFADAVLLAGPAAGRPGPNDEFFDDKIRYSYLYQATDTKTLSAISTDDDAWTDLGTSDFWGDPDDDNLLELQNFDGVDIDEQIIRNRTRYPTGAGDEYAIETQGGKLTVTASETGEVVGAINEHGVLLPTSPVITSDTTLRSRTEIYQCDTSGLGNALTLTIGTELENADQIFAVKDVGGSAGLNEVEVIPESGTDIDGSSNATINSDYGRLSAYYSSAENQWFSLFTSL